MMKKIISILLFATVALHAQSNTENYIQTRVYLEPTTTEGASAKKMESVQYFDGLGRPKQEIAVKGSPSGKDIVSYLEYDVTGRQTKNYLPVPQSGTQNGAIYASPLGNASASYGSEKIYSESILDNSPLNRVLKQTDVGTQWNTKPMQLGYDTNKISEVYQYLISTTWENGITKNILSLSPTETYPPGQLYKSTVKNEDEVETVEFKNKKGQTILVRKIMSSTLHVDTYYAYNEYGQLVYVLPPEAIHKSITDTLLNDLCYQYRYDRWSRLAEKKIPGKGWEYMVYDKQDRLVASQDSNLKEKGQWLYTTYDKFGRVAFTGIATGGDRNTEQGLADGISGNNVKRSGSAVFNRQGMDVFYDPATSYPHASKWITLLSVNYYDTYPAYSFNPPFPSSIQGEPVLKEVAYEGKSTKGLPVMSFVKNIEDDNWTKNYIYYDQKGRTVGSYSINHLGGYTKTESLLDFAGVTKQSKAYHKRLAADPEKVITQTFTYDHQNRLLVHKHQVDTNPEEILVQNEYNELSQVKNRKLGGTNPAQPLQNIDYTYNIRGWLTKINDPSNLNGKLFGYEMKYTNPVNPNVAPGKFSGMITEVDWKNASEDVLKRYNYAYDALGRLKDAVYSEPNATVPFNNNYNEYVTYDLNGNIKTLKRNAFPASGGTTSAQVDDLIYNYTGNRLTKVTENALNDTGYEGGNNIISYDLNGNMKDMLDKGIQSVQYNFLDLSNAYTVQQSNGFEQILNSTMSYLYRADGTKLRKTYSSAPPRGTVTTRITDYLDGFQYSYTEGGGICLECRTESAYEEQAYKNASLILPGTLTPEWRLDFVSTAAGYYSFTENRYIYQYRDHLGNARVTFAQNSAGVPEIIDTNNYYPFGLNHISGAFSTSNFGSFYSYKYNGKELQETGLFDYGWRQYMPDLGRWNGIDKLAENYNDSTPYGYVLNNPILNFDPNGMLSQQFIDSIHNSSNGTTWFNTGIGFTSNGGKSMDYDGNNINWSNETAGDLLAGVGAELGALYFNVPVDITVPKGNSRTWNDRLNNGIDSYVMYSKFTSALWNSRLNYNRSVLANAIETTKVGQSVSAAENFMFLELPASLAGGELLAAGWRAAGMSRLICGPVGRLTNGLIKICFTEGTLVAVEKGSKKIEDIKEGDLVWSYNEETGKKELKKVAALYRNTSSSLVKISVNGTEITCTPEHPFYVNESWVEAKNLVKGMLLTTLDGKTSLVESIKFLDEKVKVYNFEVEGNHNYYVSEKGILVHNDCGLPQLLSRVEGNMIGGEFKYASGEIIDFLGYHNAKGSTLEITEMVFYPRGAVGNEMANQFGNRQMIQSLKVLQNYARENGFTHLRLQFERAANSSAKNPGHIFDQLFKL